MLLGIEPLIAQYFSGSVRTRPQYSSQSGAMRARSSRWKMWYQPTCLASLTRSAGRKLAAISLDEPIMYGTYSETTTPFFAPSATGSMGLVSSMSASMKRMYSSVKLASDTKCITDAGLLYEAEVSLLRGLCR